MPTTKLKISEQAQRIYARYVDRENIEPVVYKEEIMLLVEQAINETLEIRSISGRSRNRVTIPKSSIAKYASQAVSSNQLTLPAFPVDLEKDMGVWEIVDPSNPLVPFIPVDIQTLKVYQGTVLGSLQNQIGFYRYGDKVNFVPPSGVTVPSSVDVYLIVSDFSSLGDNDPLPLSSSQERTALLKVMESLGAGAFAQNELNSRNNREDLLEDADQDLR